MSTNVINVAGMTCGHCVSAVTAELSAVPGVTGVEVDLHAGGVSPVTLTTDSDLPEGAVQAAVEEAGYSLA